MSTPVRYKSFDQLSFADFQVYSKLPPHPFWSHVESKIDFSLPIGCARFCTPVRASILTRLHSN